MRRVLVVWCPDWPVTALSERDAERAEPADTPVAVVSAGRVVACSPAARAAGVRRRMRPREAQSRCPALRLRERDPAAEARAFEPVAVRIEEHVTPRLEIIRPGLLAFPARGAARYWGGETALAERTVRVVAEAGFEARTGIADTLFAAALAARRANPEERLIPPGLTSAFLARYPVGVLGSPELGRLLGRLGISTLGDFAALPADRVLSRFGPAGAAAHRTARGLESRAPHSRTPGGDRAATAEFDPPEGRLEPVVFRAKALADELHASLRASGVVCARVEVGVELEDGRRLTRTWRHEGLSAQAVAERVRWQLAAWRAPRPQPTARPGEPGNTRPVKPGNTADTVESTGAGSGPRTAPAEKRPARLADGYSTGAANSRPGIADDVSDTGPDRRDTDAVPDGAPPTHGVEGGNSEASEGGSGSGGADGHRTGREVVGLSGPGGRPVAASSVNASGGRTGLGGRPGRGIGRSSDGTESSGPRGHAGAADSVGPARPAGGVDGPGSARAGVGARGRPVGGPGAGGVVRLTLVPEGLRVDEGRQGELFGSRSATLEEVERAAARLQAMLGHGAVTRVELGAGRSPGERVVRVPFGDVSEGGRSADGPWPGRLPAPHPAVVYPAPRPARLLDSAGVAVEVSGRAVLSAPPAALGPAGGGGLVPVTGWAGPWPVLEQWWDPSRSQRVARLQVTTGDGRAWLLRVAGGVWCVEACYG
ncbi:DNA polymerase Y family protein [Streptomyces durbertensis]|uniref:DNA polymerase Y family protein n=2 Tax=Streptomyces durbertensis TaxID=2448886 RepID=A0ABR6EEE4_9ACTN|nr:DNA polymerase Y family protein [Streptomyces durbertensis]